MRSVLSLLFLSVSLILIGGCPSASPCPAGTEAIAGGCVPVDAPVADAGPATDGAMPTPDVPVLADGGIPADVPTTIDAPSDTCPLLTFYEDLDGDGAGSDVVVMACAIAEGLVASTGDCDDDDAAVSPTAAERCDMAMVDEDCDGMPNDGCDCWQGQTRTCPGGSDVGECSPGIQTCGADGRWIAACEGIVGPITERCDSRDNDCDGTTDGRAADAACPDVANSSPRCETGACAFVCDSGYADCSASAGCETTLGTASNCSACGRTCAWDCGTVSCNDPDRMALGPFGLQPQTTCVTIAASGGVACWGDNGDGEVGNGETTDVTRAVAVEGLPAGRYAIDVATSVHHSCAILVTTRISTSGGVYCWGANDVGQLGNGGTADSLTPVAVTGLTDAVEIVAGSDFTCARRSGGTVQCWGENGSGQLGDGATTDRRSPVTVMGVSGATSLDAAIFRMCAGTGTGVTCWGSGHTGREARSITGGASRVAAGDGHTCALTGTTLRCWGENADGQVGNGSTTDVASPTVITLPAGIAIDVSAGSDHTCAVNELGNAYCWGDNGVGRLGDGTTANRTMPTAVSTLTGVFDIEAGDRYSCALSRIAMGETTAARMHCWGYNVGGELGDGTTTDRLSPVAVRAPL